MNENAFPYVYIIGIVWSLTDLSDRAVNVFNIASDPP